MKALVRNSYNKIEESGTRSVEILSKCLRNYALHADREGSSVTYWCIHE
jgi:hypothetical protein